MAEEEKDEQVTEEEPQAEEQPAAEEAPAEEPVAEAKEAPAEEPVAEAEEAPAEAAEAAEPEEALSPKQQRKHDRARHSGEAAPPRGPEERTGERETARRAKAERRRAHRVRSREKARARRAAKPAVEPVPPVERSRGRAKVRQGTVVSDRADKTITVRVDVARRHPRYEKIVRSSSTLHAHDERNEANIGDTVRVIESRPLSRSKRWRLVEILERAK